MTISSARIASILTIGENLNIEFKKASEGPKADTFESVCAFLNKAGGDLLLGVFFHQVRLADELGSGVRNLYHYGRIYSGKDPTFEEDDVFRLTVPLDDSYSADRAVDSVMSEANREAAQETSATTIETTTETTTETAIENLGEGARKVYEAIRKMPNATLEQIAAGVSMTRDGVFYHVKTLRKEIGLRHEGATKKGHWVFDHA